VGYNALGLCSLGKTLLEDRWNNKPCRVLDYARERDRLLLALIRPP
jgi:hypothetical protein